MTTKIAGLEDIGSVVRGNKIEVDWESAGLSNNQREKIKAKVEVWAKELAATECTFKADGDVWRVHAEWPNSKAGSEDSTVFQLHIKTLIIDRAAGTENMMADMPLRQVFQDGVNYGIEHGGEQPYDADKIQKAFEESKDRYLNGWGQK